MTNKFLTSGPAKHGSIACTNFAETFLHQPQERSITLIDVGRLWGRSLVAIRKHNMVFGSRNQLMEISPYSVIYQSRIRYNHYIIRHITSGDPPTTQIHKTIASDQR